MKPEFAIPYKGKFYKTYYITQYHQAVKQIHKLDNCTKILGLDIETKAKQEFKTNRSAPLSPRLGDIRLIQIFSEETEEIYVFDMDYIPLNLLEPLLTSKKFIAHNAKFEISWFKIKGIEIDCGCTLIAAKLILQATKAFEMETSLSLESLVTKVLKLEINKKLGASDWSINPLTFEQVEYSAYDALYALKLAHVLLADIYKKNMIQVYKLYKEVQLPLVEMELSGLLFDEEAHKNLIESWRTDFLKAREELLKVTGLKEITPNKVSDWLKNNLSEDDLNTWPKTATGKLSTASDTFDEYEHLPIVAPFLAFQKKEKLLSTYGTKLREHISSVDKRIHPTYHIAGARTGRLSCSNPNIQNQPRGKEVRSLYIAPPGRKLIFADFSQIEVRVAAEISQDEAMLNVFRNGQDIYKELASRLMGKNEVLKHERQYAKAILLGSLFGLGAAKFSFYAKSTFGIEDLDEDKAREYIEIFRKTYPDFRKWQIDQANECEESLEASTILGKKRKLDKDSYYGMSLNVPVQGTAAEIIFCSLIRYYKIKEKSSLLIACVHDEIGVEVNEECADKELKKLEKCMIAGYLEIFPDGVIRGLVEGKVGNNWGECK